MTTPPPSGWGKAIRWIARAACDQCTFCTEMCPRYLLGHPIQPHLAMRALAFNEGPNPSAAHTLYCCECNICSLIACPEDLDPKNVCVQLKQKAREEGMRTMREDGLMKVLEGLTSVEEVVRVTAPDENPEEAK